MTTTEHVLKSYKDISLGKGRDGKEFFDELEKYYLSEKELEKQRYGRNKSTTINHSYINSGEYRNKFNNISNNDELNRIVYKVAKKMLYHRSGTLFEDMYWIDIDTGEVFASEINQKV